MQATILNTPEGPSESFDGNRNPALAYLARQATRAVTVVPVPTTMLEWALAYAKPKEKNGKVIWPGYHVFPLHNIDEHNLCTCMKGKKVYIEHESGKKVLRRCWRDQPGKHPRIGKKFDFMQREYYQQATNSKCNIIEWWTKWPNANIGIAPQYGELLLDYDNKDTAKFFARFLGYDKVRGVLPNRRDRSIDLMLAGTLANKSPRGYHAAYTTAILFASYHNEELMVDGSPADPNAILDENGVPLKFDVKCWRNFVVAGPSIVLKDMAKKVPEGQPKNPPKWRRKHYKNINLLPPAPLPGKLEELFLEHLTVKHNPMIHDWITDTTPNGWAKHILDKMSCGLTPEIVITPTSSPLVTRELVPEMDSLFLFPFLPFLRDGVTGETPSTPVTLETLVETQPEPQAEPQEPQQTPQEPQHSQIVTREAITSLLCKVDDDYEYLVAMKVREMLERYKIDRSSKDTKRNRRTVKVVTSLINTSRSLGKGFVRRVTRGWLKAQRGSFKANIEDAHYDEIDDLIELYWNCPSHSPQQKDYIDAWMRVVLPVSVTTNIKMLKLVPGSWKVLEALLQIVLWKMVHAPTEMPLIWFTWNQVLIMTGLTEDKLKEHRKKFVTWPAVNIDAFHRGPNTASIVELLTEIDYGHPVKGKPEPGKFELNKVNATWLGVI